MLRRVLTHRAAVGQRRAPRSATRQWPVAATRHCTTDERSQAPQLLIVYHSRTGFALQLADALEQGARAVADEMELPLQILRRRACDASAEDLLGSDAFLFCAPENLASLSGEMKEFFDRNYYHMFDTSEGGDTGRQAYTETSKLLGKPYGLVVAAGSDGTAAARQVERICVGWRLRTVAESLVERNGLPQTAAAIRQPKSCPPEAKERCLELGGIVAASVLL